MRVCLRANSIGNGYVRPLLDPGYMPKHCLSFLLLFLVLWHGNIPIGVQQ